MTIPTLSPSESEIKRWLRDTIRHCWHIEYYLERLQTGHGDIQRPHDIMGLGNKLEWDAIRGFALQYRGQEFFESHVLPSLKFHRQQHHHCAWNDYNPTASVDAMRLGATDACCSLLEPRGYQGGCHTWEELHDISIKNPIHKVAWMLLIAQEMKKIEKPDISAITLDHIPRGGISAESCDIIEGRIQQTLSMLKKDHGIIIT